MLIEALQPLLVHLPDCDLQLEPGQPVDILDDHAVRLLAKVPDKVRRVEQIVPLVCNQPICWKSADGSARCGVVDFWHVEPDGTQWVFVTMPDGRWAAVNLRYIKEMA